MQLKLSEFKSFPSSLVKIKTIEEKDIDQAVLLLRQLRNEPKEALVTEEERKKTLLSPVKFGAFINDKLVSIASSNGLAIKTFQILGVVTDTNYQKKGIAKALCSHLINFMQKQGAENSIIFTGLDNTAAQKCYLALGFKIIGTYYLADFQ
ncbi:MAG: GNAT family N-acetyltransferase [Chlamydiae bacterium]|nr:GNAT family N-acetyltransferase [Chlamydiota bacterium]